ncbi:MAG: class I SAM-dependent methyltransferase [Desulfobacteraceae bacterium]|nr:class I SAM-dependent methyltransferase [Desulfobacteraceae bacterium]
MGYVFNFSDANKYEQWCASSKNRLAAELENRLMLAMLKPVKGETVLDIGCGTGSYLFPFIERGLQVTGLDPSPYMIDIASRNMGNRVDLHKGVAEDLPFDDNSFNCVCLIKTLEFVDDPEKAVEEACRVAKDRIFIGIINRYSSKAANLRVRRIFTKNIYNHAHFFSIWELKNTVRRIVDNVPVSWRTVGRFPSIFGEIGQRMEQFFIVQRLPFGAFAGMTVILVPRFRARPLELPHSANRAGAAMAGLTRRAR